MCGIARPEPLEAYVKGIAADVHMLTYKDHHYFVTTDLEEIKAAHDNWTVPGQVIITTEKDAARLQLHQAQLATWGIPVIVIPINVLVLLGQETELDVIVQNYVERTIAENNENFANM